jgi:ferredoxin
MEIPMVQLSDHPTVQRVRAALPKDTRPPQVLDADWLRTLCLEAGADDVGFVPVDHPDLAAHRSDTLTLFPAGKALISIVCRMNRENIRTPMRSIANLEFHHTSDEVNDVARRIVRALDAAGIRAINGGAAGFPMEAGRWDAGRLWIISHKPIAVAAGLGQMGIHRNVIHPRFGSFVLLGTVIVAAEIATYAKPLGFNPCLECKLCVAACPTGAISPDGHFNFAACYTHNYREFMGGFGDWVETVAESGSARDYRQKVSGAETVSMWQSLSFGANYKAAYCLSVCPAGEERDRSVPRRSPAIHARDAQAAAGEAGNHLCRARHRRRGFRPAQPAQRAGQDRSLRIAAAIFDPRLFARSAPCLPARAIEGASRDLSLHFHRSRAGGGDNCHPRPHAQGYGRPSRRARSEGDRRRRHMAARFLRKEASLPWALLRRRVRLKGSPRLLLAFGRCFPS